MIPKIVLVRHGRSRHVHSGWIDRAGFLRWRDAYEAAGIDPDDLPPADLRTIAAAADVLVASAAPRAIESARALAPGRGVLPSPLLHELALDPPSLGAVRLPLFGWALTFAVRWLAGKQATPEEAQRGRAAAEWLAQLAATRGSVLAVTHASFRSLLARELAQSGWRCEPPRKSHHWSAWSFSRIPTQP